MAGVRGVRTSRRELAAAVVVNAAGTWGGRMAALAGVQLPVQPRRGFVLVTEPLPPLIRHKVYAAEYMADVASGSAALQTSPVVEGTPAGPVLHSGPPGHGGPLGLNGPGPDRTPRTARLGCPSARPRTPVPSHTLFPHPPVPAPRSPRTVPAGNGGNQASSSEAIHSSTPSAVRGNAEDMSRAPSAVITRSSSILTPIPRSARGNVSSSGWR